MFVFFALQVPAGLSLYWVVGNGLALGQQLYVNRQKDRWEKDASLKTAAIIKKNGSSNTDDDSAETDPDKRSKEKTGKQAKPGPSQAKSGTRRKRRKRR